MVFNWGPLRTFRYEVQLVRCVVAKTLDPNQARPHEECFFTDTGITIIVTITAITITTTKNVLITMGLRRI